MEIQSIPMKLSKPIQTDWLGWFGRIRLFSSMKLLLFWKIYKCDNDNVTCYNTSDRHIHDKKFIIIQMIKNIYSTPFDCILHLDVIEMWQLMGVGSQNKFQIYIWVITWPLKRDKGKLVDITLDSLSLFFSFYLSKYLLFLLSTNKGLAFMFHMFLYSKAKEKCACTQINTHSCIEQPTGDFFLLFFHFFYYLLL